MNPIPQEVQFFILDYQNKDCNQQYTNAEIIIVKI